MVSEIPSSPSKRNSVTVDAAIGRVMLIRYTAETGDFLTRR